MEKNTILAIILSAFVLIGFQLLSAFLYPPEAQNVSAVIENNQVSTNIKNIAEPETVKVDVINITTENRITNVNLETDVFNITFNTQGASISSLKLKDYEKSFEDTSSVDIVFDKAENSSLFNTAFGNYKNSNFLGVFDYKVISNEKIEFFLDFEYLDNGRKVPLRYIKTYTFNRNEYLFDLSINLSTLDNSPLPKDSENIVYSLKLADQIGPEFEKLDRREDYRKFSILNSDGKRKEPKRKKSEAFVTENYSWAAIEAKFFTVAIIPENINSYVYYNDSFNKVQLSSLNINRESNNGSVLVDSYKIYAGPKDKTILANYNKAEKNSWGLENVRITEIINFWVLGQFFMFILVWMNKIINNYGLSIIVLTLGIKAILHPFTKKSFDSMAKMQAIQPKIQELQGKYKEDSTKLNAAMAELYKKEGVNPLGGCLPMVLQMPIFITFYSLFNEFIGLRGAAFIPGWINDLSQPEYIYQLGFNIPLLGWDAIRILPILYVGSQLISMKFTQNKQQGKAAPQGAAAMQTKMLTLGMPIMFFFIMYNQSSGLLLYWITMNLVTSIQQIWGTRKNLKQINEEKEQKQLNKKGKKK
jgi:YidC/Oxa1 family membrane protein insertase